MPFVFMRHLLVGSQRALRWGLVARKTKPWFEAFCPIRHPLGRGEGLEMELIIDHTYVMKPLKKSPKSEVWRRYGLVNTSTCQEGGPLQLRGDRSPCSPESSRTHLMYLIIWLFIRILYYILYNKRINLSKYFPEFCEPF